MGTLSWLLLAENFNIKFFKSFSKTDRDGGGLGVISYYSCVREGSRVSHAKFQVSRSICSLTVVFCKNDEVGGGSYYQNVTPLKLLYKNKSNMVDGALPCVGDCQDGQGGGGVAHPLDHPGGATAPSPPPSCAPLYVWINWWFKQT